MRKLLSRLIILAILLAVYFSGNMILNNMKGNKDVSSVFQFTDTENLNPETIIVSGTFNQWAPADSNYTLTQQEDGSYFLKTAIDPGIYYYQYHLFLPGESEPVSLNDPNRTEEGADFSKIEIVDFDRVKYYYDYIMIGLIALMALFTILEPLIALFMRLPLRFNLKLGILIIFLAMSFNLAIMLYNRYSIQTMVHNESLYYINNYIGLIVNDGETEDEAVQNEQESQYSPLSVEYVASFNSDRAMVDEHIVNDNLRKMLEEDGTVLDPVISRFMEREFGEDEEAVFTEPDKELVRESFLDENYRDHMVLEMKAENGYYLVIYTLQGLGDSLEKVAFFNLRLRIGMIVLILLIMLHISGIIRNYLRSLIDWTRHLIKENFDIEKDIKSNDEFEILARNFDELRISLGNNMHYLKLMNSITATLQRITQIDDLFNVFLSCLTANFGLAYNRAAVFLKDEDSLIGRYAIGMLDEKEMKEKFGNYSGYTSLSLTLSEFTENYKEHISHLESNFVNTVQNMRVDMFDASILWDVYNRNAVLYISDQNQYLNEADQILRDSLNLREAVFLPLYKGGDRIGVLMVDNYFHKKPIGERNINQLQIFINDFATNLENAFIIHNLEELVDERTRELNQAMEGLKAKDRIIRTDLTIAQRIQRGLLPMRIEQIKELNFDIKYFPMSEVGGDFYDITEIKKGIIRVFLADATGHGVQAALITMLIKGEYEKLKNTIGDPAELLKVFNNSYIQNYNYLSYFFTCIVIDFDLNKMIATYASAGHPNQYHITEAGINEILPTGKLMGIMPDVIFKNAEFSFSAEDKFLLFTDGLFEQFNDAKEEFNEGRLLEKAVSIRDLPVEKLSIELLTEVYNWMGSETVNDDITIIGISVNK